MRIVTEQTWREQAACRNHPELDWTPSSPSGGQSMEMRRNLETCIAICHTCPVFRDCLKESATELAGIWAGRLLDRRPKPERRTIEGDACGTNAGYKRHFRAQEPACEPCRIAHSAYSQEQKRQQREAS